MFFLLACAVVVYRDGGSLTPPTSTAATAAKSSTTAPVEPSASAHQPTASEPMPSASPTTPGVGHNTGSASAGQQPIQVTETASSAKPFQTVQIRGRYAGGADTLLRVQRWEGGMWLDFPVPMKTDKSGEFTAYVEVGKPGRYWLRVLDPNSGVKSEPFALVVRA